MRNIFTLCAGLLVAIPLVHAGVELDVTSKGEDDTLNCTAPPPNTQ